MFSLSSIAVTALSISLLVLVALAWRAWKDNGGGGVRWLAFAARTLGILLIAFSITNPQSIKQRPVTGANQVLLLADNSQGLNIQDNDDSLNRGETLRSYLTDAQSSWINEINEQYQVKNYKFDRSLRRIHNLEALGFDGTESNIGRSLNETFSRIGSNPVAAIVLFTDGIATDLTLSDEELKKLPPVFPVLVGRSEPVPDVALVNPQLSESAFGDSPLRLDFGLTQTFKKPQMVRSEIRRLTPLQDGGFAPTSIVDSATRSLADNARQSLEWQPSGGGIQFYELTVARVSESEAPPNEEATLANNRHLFVADRGKEKYRILYLTGRPNWEYKFLNRAVAEDPQLDLVGLIRVASREPNFEFKGRAGEQTNSLYRGFGREDENERFDEAVLIRMGTRDQEELKTGFPSEVETLFAYDAIVIDDLEASFFTFNQQTLIRDFVKIRGGGLLVLGGVNALEDGGYHNTPIEAALPVYLNNSGEQGATDSPVQWNLTREGWVEPWMRIRPFETDERERLSKMPLLRVYNSLDRIKPGSRTLATIDDGSSHSRPALVTRNFGSGRVATLALGDFWRWGMKDSGTQSDLAQFWRQLSRWLVKDNPMQVELTVTPSVSGELVFSAYAKDATFHPLQTATATLDIQRLTQTEEANTESFAINLEMLPVSNKPGHYSTTLATTPEGAYRAHLRIESTNGVKIAEAETGWVSQPLAKEFASLLPGRESLQRIATQTGGRLLELDELNQLPGLIESSPAPIMETWSEPMWHKELLFLLALACFLSEWLLRRKRGLA